MERAELLDGIGDSATAIVFLTDVACDRRGLTALGLDGVGGLLGEREIEISRHHESAFARGHDRRRTAVADRELFARVRRTVSTATRDQRNFTVEASHL